MESSQLHKNHTRKKRTLRIRKRVRGSQEKPRLCVNRTGKHLYLQLIDDENAVTLASISTLSKQFRQTEFGRKNKNSAKELGLKIAELAKEKEITRVVFDRGFCKYHGAVAAVADGAREGGLLL